MNDIQLAAFELRLDDLTELVKSGRPINGSLLAACSSHDAEPDKQRKCIEYLLEAGSDVNEPDKNGVTPLHRAVRFRNLAAVEVLLARGADVNAQDKKSRSTPLHRAVTHTGAPKTAGKRKVARDIVNLLLKSGVDKTLKNKCGKTAREYTTDQTVSGLLG